MVKRVLSFLSEGFGVIAVALYTRLLAICSFLGISLDLGPQDKFVERFRLVFFPLLFASSVFLVFQLRTELRNIVLTVLGRPTPLDEQMRVQTLIGYNHLSDVLNSIQPIDPVVRTANAEQVASASAWLSSMGWWCSGIAIGLFSVGIVLAFSGPAAADAVADKIMEDAAKIQKKKNLDGPKPKQPGSGVEAPPTDFQVTGVTVPSDHYSDSKVIRLEFSNEHEHGTNRTSYASVTALSQKDTGAKPLPNDRITVHRTPTKYAEAKGLSGPVGKQEFHGPTGGKEVVAPGSLTVEVPAATFYDAIVRPATKVMTTVATTAAETLSGVAITVAITNFLSSLTTTTVVGGAIFAVCAGMFFSSSPTPVVVAAATAVDLLGTPEVYSADLRAGEIALWHWFLHQFLPAALSPLTASDLAILNELFSAADTTYTVNYVEHLTQAVTDSAQDSPQKSSFWSFLVIVSQKALKLLKSVLTGVRALANFVYETRWFWVLVIGFVLLYKFGGSLKLYVHMACEAFIGNYLIRERLKQMRKVASKLGEKPWLDHERLKRKRMELEERYSSGIPGYIVRFIFRVLEWLRDRWKADKGKKLCCTGWRCAGLRHVYD
jgi:hypothetical protein